MKGIPVEKIKEKFKVKTKSKYTKNDKSNNSKNNKVKRITKSKKKHTTRTLQVFYLASLSRVLTLILTFSTQYFISNYDMSSSLFISNAWQALLRFDAVHFLNISFNRGYQFENQFAFFPLYPALVRSLNDLLYKLGLVKGRIDDIFITGVLISNICLVLASLVMYRLAFKLVKDEAIAYRAALLFAFTPCPGFMSSMYTESLFAFLSFSGVYLLSLDQEWLSTLTFSLTTFVRSNGLLFAGYIIHNNLFNKSWKEISIAYCLFRGINMIFKTMLIISGYILFQYYAYSQFCTELNSILPPWCEHFPPFIYPYIQKFYWNNGFLKYYQLSQLPNFFLAAPFVGISALGIWEYIQYDRLRFFSLGLLFKHEKDENSIDRFGYHQNKRLLPHVYLWLVLLLYCVLFMHIQVIIRFFTSIPIFYIFIATKLQDSRNWFAVFIIRYWVIYGVISTVLFAAFLPPA